MFILGFDLLLRILYHFFVANISTLFSQRFFHMNDFLNLISRFRRQTHVTPKSYLSFLDGYKNLYSQKHAEINEMASRMNTGLEKLIEASESVDKLSKELAVKEKELAVANVKADKVSFDQNKNEE
jgi:hypothetical protein